MESGLDQAMAKSPDEMTQIPRELTMLRGAVSSLHGVVGDLLGKVSPAVRDEPENDELREIPTRFPVTTEVSRALREIYEEVSTIENKLARATHRLEL